MRIDLHCHTLAVKSGDPQTRNVSPDLFAEKVKAADVKIVGITNHNKFDIKQYHELVEAVSGLCLVWPGVEFDIMGHDGKRWHLILISNPEAVNQFHVLVDEQTKDCDLDTCAFDIEDVVRRFKPCDIFFIPHYNKNPGISDNELNVLYDLVGEPFRIFAEPSNPRTLGILTDNNMRALLGSDVKDWTKYERLEKFAELRLSVTSFAQFKLLAQRDKHLIETILNHYKPYEMKAYPGPDGIALPLKIYPEINIVFGAKGTGKTEILKSLKSEFDRQGIPCVSYTAADRSDEFDKLIMGGKGQCDINIIGAKGCDNEFDVLFEWADLNPVPLSTYIEYERTKNDNENKRKLEIAREKPLLFPDTQCYQRAKSEMNAMSKMMRAFDDIEYKRYLEQDEATQLLILLSKLSDSIYRCALEKYIDIEAVKLTDKSLEAIKDIADGCSGTRSDPGETGFAKFAINRLNLKRTADLILKNLCCSPKTNTTFIGDLEGKGKIYTEEIFRMLCKESTAKEFGSGRFNKLKHIKKLLEEISKDWTQDISEKLSDFRQSCFDKNVRSTAAFLGSVIQTIDESGQAYQPSNGEKGILLLQRALTTRSNVYIIDEPELGMGNSYIDNDIRPKLSALARQKKVVIIATHNANIAVRTLPYMSIFREYKDGKYLTYAGNPFSDLLINLEDETDSKSWKEECLHTLEGGEEAFYDRSEIYAAGDHNS